MEWTEDIYKIWRAEWTKAHPDRIPPEYLDFKRMVEMFNFSVRNIFGLELEGDSDAR